MVTSFRQRGQERYAFIEEYRDTFRVRAMCRCLAVRPSGCYARQTKLIRHAWNDSNKVYGYRKLHDDLMDQGKTAVRTAWWAGLCQAHRPPMWWCRLCTWRFGDESQKALRLSIPIKDRSSPVWTGLPSLGLTIWNTQCADGATAKTMPLVVPNPKLHLPSNT